jgi:LEA14-like dessication related protein
MKKGLAILGVGVLVVGIGLYITEQIRLVKSICYKITNYTATKLSLDSAEFSVNLEVTNKSSKFNVNVSKVDVDVYVNGVFSSKVTSETKFNILPSSVINVPLEVDFNPKQFLQSLGSILGASSKIDDIKITLMGKITAQKGIVPLFVPFEFVTTIGELKSNQGTSTC